MVHRICVSRRAAWVLLAGIYLASSAAAQAANTRNILLTGYWYPTNEMLAQFSTDPLLNGNGWQGDNWEGRGYDVYAHFPTYPTGSGNKGVGDFEVDYQDTSDDFWRITDEIDPVAILSFGRGAGPWEVEYRAINRSSWNPDYLAPDLPTPSPPDSSMPANAERYTTLPASAIEAAVDGAGIGVDAWVDWNGNAGSFLCNYMFYHDTWYQALHAAADDPNQCVSAGFIHVAGALTVAQGALATEVTLREVIAYVGTQIPGFGDTDGDGDVDIEDISVLAANWDQCGKTWADGDFTGDGCVTIEDLSLLAANWGAGTSSSSVPEPATLSALVLGGLAAVIRKGRR